MSKITTIWTYQLNNVQTEFAVNFDYLSRKFVQVTLIGKDRKVLRMNVDYRFIGPKTIKTNKAWGSNDGYQYLEIRRVTSATDSIVDFSDGSILRAGDLTIANLQSMHIAEEARNLAGDALGVNDDGQLDARARRIVNLGNPVGRLDAVNKAYVDDAEDGAVQARDKALQYRNEAEGFRNEALSAKTTVESKIGYLDAKYERAEQLNTEANKNSSKALEAVAGAQRSAQEAASSASNAKASEKNAKTSEDKAREFAGSIDPDTLVKKAMITQETGNDVSLVVSQDLMTKEVNKLMPKTGGEFSGTVTLQRAVINGNNRLDFGQLDTRKGFWIPSGGSALQYFDINPGVGNYLQNFQKKNGTIALAEDYIPKTGGTFTGRVSVTLPSGYAVLRVGSENKYFTMETDGNRCVFTTWGGTVTMPLKSGTLAIAGQYKLDDHYKRTRSSIAKSKLSERELRKEIEDLKIQIAELKELVNDKH